MLLPVGSPPAPPISLIYSLEMSGICVCRQDPNKTTGFTCVALYLSPWVSWPFKVMEGTELVVQEICTFGFCWLLLNVII